MNEEEFSKLEQLCRLSCSQEEKSSFLSSLKNMLKYVDLLNELPTDNVLACFSVLESQANVMQEDEPHNFLSRDDFLRNAPSHTGGMIRVPPVLKQES